MSVAHVDGRFSHGYAPTVIPSPAPVSGWAVIEYDAVLQSDTEMVIPAPVRLPIIDGRLCDVDGAPGPVEMQATDDPALFQDGALAKVTVQLSGSQAVKFSVDLPTGETVQLHTVAPGGPGDGRTVFVAGVTPTGDAGLAQTFQDTGSQFRSALDDTYIERTEVGSTVETPAGAQAKADAAEAEAKTYAGTLAYGTNLEATDATVAAFVDDPGSQTGAALRDAFASQIDVTGKSASQINAWLATASTLGVKRMVGSVTITAPLVVVSNTNLQVDAALTSTFVGNFIRNEHWNSLSERDENIRICGGDWFRNSGAPTGGSGAGWAVGAFSMLFRHVDHLTIRDVTIRNAGAKYCIAVGDVTDFYIADVYSPGTASDTVHVTGPANNGVIERVRSNGGDDIVAITTRDYDAYDDVNGDVANITIRDISGSTSTRMVLVAGNASSTEADSFIISGITVENVFQSGTGSAVATGANKESGRIEDLTLRNITGIINLKHPAHWTIIAENCSTLNFKDENENNQNNADRVFIYAPKGLSFNTLDAVTHIKYVEIHGAQILPDVARAVSIYGATVERVLLDGAVFTGFDDVINVAGSSAIVGELVIRNLVATIAPGKHAVRIDSANVSRIVYEAPNVTAANTTSGSLVYSNELASLGALEVRGGSVTGTAVLLDVLGAGIGDLDFTISGTMVSGCNRIAQVSGRNLKFTYAGIRMESMLNRPIRLYGSGSASIRGSGLDGYTTTAIQHDATGNVRVVAQEFPVDISILGKNNGDMAYNTNASLACGVGVVVSNGNNWKNLYTGATY